MRFENSVRFSRGLTEEELEAFRNRFRKLLAKGKEEGEVTQSAIEEAIPYSVIEDEALNDIFKIFEDQGIRVHRSYESMVEALKGQLTRQRYKWVTQSGLTERAYWIGAFEALSLTDTAQDQLNSISPKILQTLFHRSADDSFPRTNLGNLFVELESYIRCWENEFSKAKQATKKIHNELESLSHQFLECLKEAMELNAQIGKLAQKDAINQGVNVESWPGRERQVFEALTALKGSLLYLALLQTSHDMQSRFD